jgi:O-antigen/teichoic acid export membrane protein
MSSTYQINNKRIAKNTLMLYVRTLFSMFIALIISRVLLQALGVNNFGVNSAVAGVIAMFSVVSGSLSGSISRFITYELGHGDSDKLKRIFSTSINIQLVIGVFILILGETIGVWFLNTQMNIPDGRMVAANWVLQCSMLSFFIGLTQTPYTACIIGHEKMSVYAWFSIIESIFRLIIVYIIYISPFDKLISYSVLGLLVSVVIRFVQRIYCKRIFAECSYSFTIDKGLIKEMSGFAGWTFLTNTAWIFNSQGINLLVNIFFGVAFNAARGLATSIEGMIVKFSNDFTTALKPQITKSYAAGEIDEMNKLICRGSRFAYYLLFIFSLPLMFEAHAAIYLWLGQVPEYTVMFFRLTIIFVLIHHLGGTGYTACMATGRIKWYTIIITSVGFLVFPLTWIAYKLNAPVESTYYISIFIYSILNIIRLFIMRHLWGFPISMFLTKVIKPIVIVTVLSIIAPLMLYLNLEAGIIKAFVVMFVSVISCLIVTFIFGLNSFERTLVLNKTKIIFKKFFP